MIKSVLLVLSAFTLTVRGDTKCPPAASIHPCVCEPTIDNIVITCRKFDNEDDLVEALKPLHNIQFNDLMLFDSHLDYFPSDLFDGFGLKRIFLFGTTVVSLSDSDIAFQGLEKSLETIFFQETQLLGGWNWSLLRKLKAVTALFIQQSNIEVIDDDFQEISHLNLKQINFNDTQISWMHDAAFAKFKSLERLTLTYNEITEVKRSMFPNPAEKLTWLDLGNNKLEKVPADLFAGMPALKSVMFKGNNLFTIEEKLYARVWSQMRSVIYTGNPLRCDCRLAWILKSSYRPLNTRGVCATPASMEGKHITDLNAYELAC